MPLAWNAVELAAAKIAILAIGVVAMMMPLRRRRRGMIVRLTSIVVVVMMGGAEMGQRLGERFHRAIRRRTDKNQHDSAGEIF